MKICKACNEGFLQVQERVRVITILEVYTFHINVCYLSCNICVASIIPIASRKKYLQDIRLKKKQLYYD